MNWCTIDKDYINYLKQFEPRIPNMEYGNNAFKPFFAPLFQVKDLVYVTQVTSPKERHYKLRESADFIKLYDNKDKLIGAVNLNYMFPVYPQNIINFTYAEIEKYRTFESLSDKSKYIKLLQNEMKGIINKSILEKAEKLYKLKLEYPNNRISQRCVDFQLLEQRCREYSQQHTLEQSYSYYEMHFKGNCQCKEIDSSSKELIDTLKRNCDCMVIERDTKSHIAIHNNSIDRANEIIEEYNQEKHLLQMR